MTNENRFLNEQQTVQILELMDGIETGVNLPPRYDKYCICWETLYRHLLSMINNPQGVEDAEENREELEEEEIEEPELPPELPVFAEQQKISRESPTKDEIAAYLESIKPQPQPPQPQQQAPPQQQARANPFKKPLQENRQVIEPPKMPPPKVSALVRPIAPQGAKNSKPIYIPPPIDEDVDLLEDV